MILSGIHSFFWTKMNDIRLRPLYSSAGRLRKNHPPARQTLRSPDPCPFFSPVFGRSKMWWSDASLDGGFADRSLWGSLAIAGACHISFRLPCFSFLRWTLIRIKTKSLPPSFYSVGQIASCHKTSLWLSQLISHRFYLSVCTMLKALRSPQSRSKLSA